jgi:hypothetical protein
MSNHEIQFFFQSFKESFYNSSPAGEKTSVQIKVGDQKALLNFSRTPVCDIMTRSISHLITDLISGSSLTLFCFDGGVNSTTDNYHFPLSPQHLGIHGMIDTYTSDRFQTAYQHGSGAIMMYDQENREGIYWIKNIESIPYWEISFPFRTLFHWWSKSSSLMLLHAGGIGTAASSAIVPGKSGSGKSSTCLSVVLHSELSIAGDDYILVDTKNNSLYSLFNCAKLEWQSLLRLQALEDSVDQGFKNAEKAMIFISDRMPQRMLLKSTLKYSFIPVVSGNSKTRIIESDRAELLKYLAPTTLFQLPVFQRETFEKCVTLTKNLRIYKLLLGTDPKELAGALYNFLSVNNVG